MRDQKADPAGLERFIDAQLTWDRAMAEALAGAQETAKTKATLVVGIIGSGHLENRWGVPRQLAALGFPNATVLLPWDGGRDCDDLVAGMADAVFVLDPPAIDRAEATWRPRLGVMLKPVERALAVLGVVPGSVAAAAGNLAGILTGGRKLVGAGFLDEDVEFVKTAAGQAAVAARNARLYAAARKEVRERSALAGLGPVRSSAVGPQVG